MLAPEVKELLQELAYFLFLFHRALRRSLDALNSAHYRANAVGVWLALKPTEEGVPRHGKLHGKLAFMEHKLGRDCSVLVVSLFREPLIYIEGAVSKCGRRCETILGVEEAQVLLLLGLFVTRSADLMDKHDFIDGRP